METKSIARSLDIRAMTTTGILKSLIRCKSPGSYFAAAGKRIKDFKIPVVVMARMSNDLAMDFVSTDDAFGGGLAAEHLLSLGHRKLAVLISEPHVPTVEAKVEGFETGPGWLGFFQDVELIDCRT